ncbi:C-type lectin domain family 2 member D isoform 2-T2 [Aulostomus maculatus]
MYIKFCRTYGADKKDEAGANLSVHLEGEKDKQAQGNIRMYRLACFILSLVCLVLLVAVIVLCVKLQTGSAVCTVSGDFPASERCSCEQCPSYFVQNQIQVLRCQQCPNGWLSFDKFCFYLSTFRLSWDESQRNCSAAGGSLAVVTSKKVQNFLTQEGKLKYWIGLRFKGASWTWVNNTELTQSYWGDVPFKGDCGILDSRSPQDKNWMKSPCLSYSYFICQLQL